MFDALRASFERFWQRRGVGGSGLCVWATIVCVCGGRFVPTRRFVLHDVILIGWQSEWYIFRTNIRDAAQKNKRLGCLHSLALRLFREINKNRISAREHHERSSNKHVARTITKYMYIQCDKSHHFPAIYIYEVGYPKVTGIILGRWVLVLLIFFRCNLVDLLVYYNKHKFIVRIAFLFP